MRIWLVLFLLLATLGACDTPESPEIYSGRGVVRGVLPDEGQVTVEHDDIEGLMPAMTMNFDVPDPELLAKLEPGQAIDFALRRRGGLYQIVGFHVIGEAEPGEDPLAKLKQPAQLAPPFSLLDQDEIERALRDWQGRAVLLDFIFTNCPGPCPISTATLVSLQKKLPEELRDRVQLVSISLDPARDTPEAMKSYAEARGVDFASWAFLTGTQEQIDPVLAAYGVGKVDGDEIEHTVVTFLIDPKGQIVKRYLGQRHSSEDLLADLGNLL
jgi:protein SCO1/2